MSKHEKLADRLSDIILRLNQGERLNIDDLADEYKVSLRTIKRDFERLRMLFFVETGKYYRLDQAKQGYLGIQDIKRFANFASISDLLPEIDRKFFQEQLNQSVLIKGFKYEDIKAKKQDFDRITQAIEEHQVIEFNYTKVWNPQKLTSSEPTKNNQISKRYRLEPYHLLNKNGIWYVVGVMDQQQRTFCFTQIRNLMVNKDEKFIVNQSIKEQILNSDSLFFGNNFIEMVIQVDASVAGYFERRDLLPNQEIMKKLANGDLLLICKDIHPREVVPIVQYWIPNLRIISPVEVQTQLEEVLKGYLGIIN